jgi:hypothetical protein
MFVSMSRTIGNSIVPFVSLKCGTGPTSIIWCTAGVSGMLAPAMRAIFGDQTPQQTTTMSVAMSPRDVRMPVMRPRSTSIPSTSVFANTLSAPFACPRSRMIVPKRSESTMPTDLV